MKDIKERGSWNLFKEFNANLKRIIYSRSEIRDGDILILTNTRQ